ncbi:radical SAM protein [Candidatus Microgenomates bacterium]|jgi:MoaA/NifB/PqqE/SkfB family radical SAM enzyme|nr:MAG: radical SAM protein [Candidatus Microgenomates bacterium]
MFKKALFILKNNPSYFFPLIAGLLRRIVLVKTFSRFLYPELITITVTNRCNFNCPGCSSNSPLYTRKNGKVKEVSLKDIKKVIDEVAVFKPFIYLNGGEPTLRDDLVEIIKYVKSKKLVCSFTTNGSLLTPDLLEKLVKAKLDFLSVSIDGPKEFHDKIRGFKGAFDRAVSGLESLRLLKNKYKVSYPHVRLASIIYPENINNSKYIINLANNLKVNELGFGFLMYYPEKIIGMQKKFVEKNKTGGEEPIGLKIDNNYRFNFDEKKYLNFLAYLKKSKIPYFFAYQGNQYKEYFDPGVFPSNKSVCLTPWNNLLIHPNGDLGVCQGFRFGSIYKSSILKQWNSEEMVRFRKKRAQGPFPVCFRCNEGQKIKFDK